MNTAAAAEESEVVAVEAMEEEAVEEGRLPQRVSPVKKIARSLGLVVSMGILFSPQLALEPGITAFAVVVAGAATFCWDVYGQPLLLAANLHSE